LLLLLFLFLPLLLLIRPRLAFRIARWNIGSTNHLSDHFTSDHDSLFELPDLSRGGKAPNQANDVLLAHHGAPRAALHANQLRVIRRAAQHPVHPYRQLSGDGDFRDSAAAAQLESLVVLS
jgi:hypothetical protein